MTTEGPNGAGAAANVDRSGETAWTDPTNAEGLIGAGGFASVADAASDYLVLSDYGFALAGSATIVGIEADLELEIGDNASPTDIITFTVEIIGPDGTAIGTPKTSDVSSASGLHTLSLGGAADLWGVGLLVGTDVNDVDFGIRVWVAPMSVTGSWVANVGAIELTLHFAEDVASGAEIPLEAAAEVSQAGITPAEALAEVSQTEIIQIEAAQSVSQDGVGSLEAQQTVEAVVSEEIEATQIIETAEEMTAESLRLLSVTGSSPLEWNGDRVEVDSIIYLEAAQGVSSDIVSAAPIRWEAKRKLILTGSMPAEINLAALGELEIDFEWLARTWSDEISAVEAAQALSGPGVLPVEGHLRVISEGQDAFEALEGVGGLQVVLVEWTGLIDTVNDIAQTGPTAVEALRFLPISGVIPAEWKNLFGAEALGRFEAKSTPASEGSQASESGRRLAPEAQVEMEAHAAAGDSSLALPNEALRRLLVPGGIPWSHSDTDQPPDHTRISGRGVLVIRKDVQAILIVARGSSGG